MNTPDVNQIRKDLGIKKSSLKKKSSKPPKKTGEVDLNALRDKIRKEK